MSSGSSSSSSSLLTALKAVVNSMSTTNLISRAKVRTSAETTAIINQKSTPPTAMPLVQLAMQLPNLFPLSFEASIRDYSMFQENAESFQSQLLSTLPFYPSPANGRSSEILKTPVDDEGNYINEFMIKPMNPSSSSSMKHLIFVHGYGAGLGFFLKNFENLPLLNNNWCIHAIDLPGYGFSSRPKFPFNYPEHNPVMVEDWFHQRIKGWLHKRGLLANPKNNLLVAHSLGAYISALYANKFPNHFSKLIMCSPAGICPSPKLGQAPPQWFVKLWDRNISPFSLVRNSFHLGSKLTSGWTYRRFRQFLREGQRGYEQHKAMHKYTYAIFNKPGSGEYLLSFALKCGGDPRFPLEKRLFRNTSSFKANCDWLWLYGDEDWMDLRGGQRASEFLKKTGMKSDVKVVPSAGHHLYLDNYKHFNSVVIKEMEKMSF